MTHIKTLAQLAELAEPWNQLAATMPFCRCEWLSTWWECFARPGDALFVLAVHDDQGALTGLAPLYRRRSALRGRVLRWLGDDEVATPYVTVLADQGRESEVGLAIANWLLSAGRDEWDTVELTGVAVDDRCVAQIVTHFRQDGDHVFVRPALPCWRTDLRGDWETYLKALSHRRRRLLRRFIREHFDTGRAVVRHLREQADFDQAFGILVDLHQKRRQSVGDRGCFASDRFGQFHRKVAQRLLASNELDLLWIEFDGEPAAVNYAFRTGGTTFLYQSGFDPKFAEHRVGWLCLIASLQHAMANGIRHFDLLRGDFAYKSHLLAEPSSANDYHLVANRPNARVRHTTWRTLESLNRWSRRNAKRGLEAVRGFAKRPAAKSASAENSDEYPRPNLSKTPKRTRHEPVTVDPEA